MNRLIDSQSLYLRKHAENPIDWWTWCDEALEKAKRENLPIFLSIGYSSCHWCTVMEGEAFSDPTIAAYMNANFVPIKVDREERPDLDSLYMQALQAITGSKGWPLNLFLSPVDRLPFYAGTYFPLEAKYGRPAFLSVLQQIRQVYDTDANKVSSIKEQVFSYLQQTVTPTQQELSADLLLQGLTQNAETLISRGTEPGFPMIPYATAALRAARFESPNAAYGATGICQQRGLDLFLGGICDHVGGGFHRYTIDPTWTVPHFEKMLYDSGQIVEYLSDLWSTGMQEPALKRAIVQTVQWLKREMVAPQGYFYASQDADSFVTAEDAEPEEGAFYVWSHSELEQHLTADELQALMKQFTVGSSGNFEGKNVLQRYQSGQLSDELEAALIKLFVIRYGSAPEVIVTPATNNQVAKTHAWRGRIPPVTDTKLIVAWNSLMISGLARAAAVFQNSEYLDLATAAAQFVVDHQWANNRLHRLSYDGQASIIAQSEDYALLIKALLDLEAAYSSSPSPWLAEAIRVQKEFDEYLWSPEGGYYNTAANDLAMRERSCDDGPIPSANGVAIANLVRLFLLTEDMTYLDRAEQALSAFSSILIDTPQRCPSLFVALDWFRNQTLIRTSAAAIANLSLQYLPTAMSRLDTELGNNIVGLVCQGLSCQAPAYSWEQLQEQVCQSTARG